MWSLQSLKTIKMETKIISFYAKKARGLMARFIIQNRIKKTDELVNFDLDGYKYSKADSTAESPVFLRKS